MAITPKQARVLNFICDYIDAHQGIAPTYRDIAAHIGIARPAAHAAVDRLINAGYLGRDSYTIRGINLIKRLPPQETSDDIPSPAPSNIARYQMIDDLIHRHYTIICGEHLGATQDKALHWLAVALTQFQTKPSAAHHLRHLSSALSNAATELMNGIDIPEF
jgi:hypothetical protein